mmetsp:Transcript_32670/g.92677  ORF Transcript_32670/g.92677 Transcript_32670/m.92677 type:complete len:377 (+) Transcript_32670:892-2022(+)
MAEDGDSILLQPGGVYAPQGQLVVRRAVQIATARGGAPAEIHLVEGIQLSSQSGCHFQRLRLRVVASAIAGLQLISGGRALLQDVDFEISETSQDCTALLVQGDTCEALLFRCRINAERLAAEADESEPEAFLQWESSRQLSVDWEPAGGDGTEGQDGEEQPTEAYGIVILAWHHAPSPNTLSLALPCIQPPLLDLLLISECQWMFPRTMQAKRSTPDQSPTRPSPTFSCWYRQGSDGASSLTSCSRPNVAVHGCQLSHCAWGMFVRGAEVLVTDTSIRRSGCGVVFASHGSRVCACGLLVESCGVLADCVFSYIAVEELDICRLCDAVRSLELAHRHHDVAALGHGGADTPLPAFAAHAVHPPLIYTAKGPDGAC